MSATTIDVSKLPTVAFGIRSPIYWGIALFCVIEGMTLAGMFFAYLYVRGNFAEWPPNDGIRILPGLASTGMLLVSLVPMALCRRSAKEMDLRPTRRWLLIATLLSLAAVPLRMWEIGSLPFLWSENAYASVVWTSLGFHCVEGTAGVVENLLITILLYRGPVEKKHFEDIETNALFWGFVVVVWLPFATFFFADGMAR